MTVLTLLRYLIGDRDAILAIAANRHSLWIGLLFVLSAGFAREYDGEDLLHEPWHLFIPLGASLVASFLLFCLFRMASNRHIVSERDFWTDYLSFLSLFWMTAPLAWLYAIPYERFVSAHLAIDLNLATLGVVAVWRVILMTRVVCVCTDMHPLTAVGIVVGFGIAVFAGINLFTVLPLIASMGGLRSFEDKTDLQKWIEGVALCPSLVLGLLCLALAYCFQGSKPRRWLVPFNSTGERPRNSLVALVLLSILGWVFVLPFTQPEQQQRYAVESAVRQGQYEDAVSMLTQIPRDAFPPHWAPPPRVIGGVRSNRSVDQIIGMVVATRGEDVPAWLREHYLGRLSWLIRSSRDSRVLNMFLAARLGEVPEGMALLAEMEADPTLDEWAKLHFEQLRLQAREFQKQKSEVR